LAALREAKRLGARTLGVTNVVGSSIAREADQVVYTYAGPEIAVASTKAYTTQLLAMLMLAIYVGRLRNTLAEDYAKNLLQVWLPFLNKSTKCWKTLTKLKYSLVNMVAVKMRSSWVVALTML
jgi:glucosamine--fructose-6-phosphate aminotransferase (isomerizing)